MPWRKTRIDFTDTVKCKFCNRDIKSGKGIVVEDENGDIAFSGPSCAKNDKNVSNPNDKIIDITKGCILQELVERKDSNRKTTTDLQDDFTPEDDNEAHNYLDENAVKAYLTLRCDKLKHIRAIPKAPKLVEIYDGYIKTEKVSSKDENYIKAIMYGDKLPRCTYKNLQAVYATEYWLLSFIEHNPNADLTFIKSNLEQLRNRLSLSEKQIEGINNWFSKSKGRTVRLKRNAFV